MSTLSQRLQKRFYDPKDHPYRVFEREVEALLKPDTVLLDAGCGRSTPVLKRYIGRVARLIGVELVDFKDVPEGIETYKTDLANLPLPDASVDLIMSRSVFEHLTDPDAVYRELARVLKPGGHILFLTANMWDYGTQVARMVPNRFHAKVVAMTEGRKEEDTFPTAYRTNTRADVNRLAEMAGLRVAKFDYLNQYPNYLMFNGALFFLGMCYERLTSKIDALKILRGWIMVRLEKPVR